MKPPSTLQRCGSCCFSIWWWFGAFLLVVLGFMICHLKIVTIGVDTNDHMQEHEYIYEYGDERFDDFDEFTAEDGDSCSEF